MHADKPAAAVVDGAELAMNVDWAADDADVAALWLLDALPAYVRHTGRHQRHSALVGRYDAAEAVVAIVGVTQIRCGVVMTKPSSPVRKDHAAVDVTGLPRASVVIGEEGSELVWFAAYNGSSPNRCITAKNAPMPIVILAMLADRSRFDALSSIALRLSFNISS